MKLEIKMTDGHFYYRIPYNLYNITKTKRQELPPAGR